MGEQKQMIALMMTTSKHLQLMTAVMGMIKLLLMIAVMGMIKLLLMTAVMMTTKMLLLLMMTWVLYLTLAWPQLLHQCYLCSSHSNLDLVLSELSIVCETKEAWFGKLSQIIFVPG